MPRTHGQRRTTEYRIWTGIKTRCHNHHSRIYAAYGGRGIQLDERWRTFEKFIEDMGPQPSPTHSIDRIDVNAHYTKANCRWATREEQARNKRNIKPLTLNGITQTLTQWSIDSGTPLKRIWERLHNGWPAAAAVFQPKRTEHPTHCKNGHPLNLTARYEGRSRRCTSCKRQYDEAYRRKHSKEER